MVLLFHDMHMFWIQMPKKSFPMIWITNTKQQESPQFLFPGVNTYIYKILIIKDDITKQRYVYQYTKEWKKPKYYKDEYITLVC